MNGTNSSTENCSQTCLLGIIRLDATHVRWFLRHQDFHQLRQAVLELGCCLVAASQRNERLRKTDGQWEQARTQATVCKSSQAVTMWEKPVVNNASKQLNSSPPTLNQWSSVEWALRLGGSGLYTVTWSEEVPQCQGIPHSVGDEQRFAISWTEAKLLWFMYKCHYELGTDSQTNFVVYGSV